MCRDVDLFGEVVVTLDDVEKWLRVVPRMQEITRPNLVADYIRGYDVVNKIKRSKLSNEFYSLNDSQFDDIRSLSNSVFLALKPKLSHIKLSTFADKQRLDKLAFLDTARPRKPRGNFRRPVDLQKAA